MGVSISENYPFDQPTGVTLTGDVTGVGTATIVTTVQNVNLTTAASGNLAVARLNSGTGASSATFWRGDGTWAAPVGTLTSIGLTDASSTAIYTVGNSPLVANGNLSITLKTQNANLVFSGPTSGGAAQPTFRSLVSADIPTLSYVNLNGSTPLTGNWAAGAFSATHNSVVVGSAANTISGLSTIVNTGTLTLPTATDTLVGRATTDTLTNKSLTGVTTGTAAAAGIIGEYVIQSTLRSAETALTTNTPVNVTSSPLSLTAGDWSVCGAVGFDIGATTSVTRLQMAISATSATLPGGDTIAVPSSSGEIRIQVVEAASIPAGDNTLSTPSYRVISSSPITLYLVAQSTFTVSTNAAYGFISARRMR